MGEEETEVIGIGNEHGCDEVVQIKGEVGLAVVIVIFVDFVEATLQGDLNLVAMEGEDVVI